MVDRSIEASERRARQHEGAGWRKDDRLAVCRADTPMPSIFFFAGLTPPPWRHQSNTMVMKDDRLAVCRPFLSLLVTPPPWRHQSNTMVTTPSGASEEDTSSPSCPPVSQKRASSRPCKRLLRNRWRIISIPPPLRHHLPARPACLKFTSISVPTRPIPSRRMRSLRPYG